jgi:hypothetical protein
MPWKINGKAYGDVTGTNIYPTSKISSKFFGNYKTVNGRYLPFCYSYQIDYLGTPPFDPPTEGEYTDCNGDTQSFNVNDGEPQVFVCAFLDSVSSTGGPEPGITLLGTSGCDYY